MGVEQGDEVVGDEGEVCYIGVGCDEGLQLCWYVGVGQVEVECIIFEFQFWYVGVGDGFGYVMLGLFGFLFQG